MNNRHKELYMQAKNGEAIYSDIDFFLWYDRVAELLIKETTGTIIKAYQGRINPAIAINAVEQHFGIENLYERTN